MNKRTQELQNQIAKWSDDTFDNGNMTRSRAIPISYHLQKEAKELTEALQNYFCKKSIDNLFGVSEELADCLMLILDCAAHAGFNSDELITACSNKLETNKKRNWGKPDSKGVVEHIK